MVSIRALYWYGSIWSLLELCTGMALYGIYYSSVLVWLYMVSIRALYWYGSIWSLLELCTGMALYGIY